MTSEKTTISSLLQGVEKMHEVIMAQKDTALVIRNGMKQRDLFCGPDPDCVSPSGSAPG